MLANKKILAWILKECVSEFKDVPLDVIAKKCIETPEIAVIAVDQDEPDKNSNTPGRITGMNTEENSEYEGKIFYDIRFNATVPGDPKPIHLIINIEAQKDDNPGYPVLKRSFYYGCRMISAQKDTVFTGSDYGRIRKVYSIWIEMNVSVGKSNTINEYVISEKSVVGNVKEAHEHYDLIDVILIRLGSENSITEKSVLRLLNVLLSRTAGRNMVNKTLRDEYGISLRGTLGKEINITCNLGEGLYESAYQSAYQSASESTQVKTWAEDALKIMEKFTINAKQAVEILSVPEEKRNLVFSLIEESLIPA